jgi:hypothetical protein
MARLGKHPHGAAHPQKGKGKIAVSNGDVRFKMPSQPVWQKSAGESMIHACLRLRESPIFWCISPWSLEGRVYLLTGPLSQRLHIAQARGLTLLFILHKLSFVGTMPVM